MGSSIQIESGKIREIWTEKIYPTCLYQQESIKNKWTTYTKENDW